MHMAQDRLYWFILADHEGSILDTRCSTDFVKMESNVMVGFLREAIQLKYTHNVLERISASMLRLYRDKESLMKGEDHLHVQTLISDDIANSSDNVIYVVPAAVEIYGSLFVDLNHIELKRFLSVGEYLIGDEETEKILNCLEHIKQFKDHAPFISISSSSGMGKTQSAFTIMKALGSISRVYYLLASPINENSQVIYRVFQEPSKLLENCVKKDLESIKLNSNQSDDEDLPLSLSEIKLMKLYTFGFIDSLLKYGISRKEEVHISPISSFKISSQVIGEDPIVILDEFMPLRAETFGYLRLLRNAFRSVGIRLIIMGTHSATSNLVEFAKNSRTDSNPWCYLFTKLPSMKTQVANLCSSDSSIHAIACHSRPLFVEMMEEFLDDAKFTDKSSLSCAFIDRLLNDVRSRILTRKPIYRNESGRHGQVCLFLNAYYPGIQLQANEKVLERRIWSLTPLVNYHFAVLDLKEEPMQIFSSGGANGQTRFHPISRFPSPEEDILLYLCFMGGRDMYPFEDDKGNRISYAKARLDLFESIAANNLVVIDANQNQPSNDGSFYESLLSSIICAASHYGGVGGILFPAFFSEMIKEMSHDLSDIDAYSKNKFEDNELLGFLKHFRVPFLSPPNMFWPSWLFQNVNGMNLANLKRSKNQDRIDIATNCGISGECKDRKNALSSSDMYEILKRVPNNSRVHLVFTNTLQKKRKYFSGKKKTFEMAVEENPKLSSCVFISFSKQNGFKFFDGLKSSDNPDCALIFILFDEK